MNKGLTHIYYGNGKGKTTAAVGLAVRCLGGGGKVLFCQFLKNGLSGEINTLKNFQNIEFSDFYHNIKFTRLMIEKEINEARLFYSRLLEDVIKKVNNKRFDLLILDEALSAISKNFISIDRIIYFIKNKPYSLEVVLTGRPMFDALFDLADYISEIKKIKHPFDKGVKARRFIEI